VIVEMPKPTDADKEFFRSLVPDDPRVETKPKFGNLGAFVNSNMFMGLFGGDVGIKLPDADREALLREKGAGPFGPAERPMGGYVTLPASWRAAPMRAEPWITKALDHVGSLPAKVKKSKTPRLYAGERAPRGGLSRPRGVPTRRHAARHTVRVGKAGTNSRSVAESRPATARTW
jgi:hypothetical protein